MTELKNSLLAESSIFLSGPSSTLKPPFQKVIVVRFCGGGRVDPAENAIEGYLAHLGARREGGRSEPPKIKFIEELWPAIKFRL